MSTKPTRQRSSETRYRISHFKVRLVRDKARTYPVATVSTAADSARIATLELRDLPHEEMIAIGVNSRNVPVGIVRVSQGGINGTAIKPSDVFRPLIGMGAAAFVLAHNHPSGDPTPSAEDVETTKRLRYAAEFVGLVMLDHVVVAREGWTSLRDTSGWSP